MSDSATTSAPAAASAPPPSVPSPTDAIIEQWFVETFHNFGLPVELFNRFRRQADALKQRLRAAKE